MGSKWIVSDEQPDLVKDDITLLLLSENKRLTRLLIALVFCCVMANVVVVGGFVWLASQYNVETYATGDKCNC